MIIAKVDPAEFHTQSIEIEPFAGGINITPVGIPIDFETMQMRRKACHPSIPGKYANLGISAQIHLTLFDKEYLVLVRQPKSDHSLLKLPSGYVSLEQLSNPYLTLAQELVEECLLLKGKHFCQLELNTQQLIQPYPALNYHSDEALQFYTVTSNPLRFPEAQIYINQQPLIGNPFLYIHKQTCSAQLVYPLRMTLPDCEELSLLHAEEQYDPISNELNVILNSELWLARVNEGSIFSLHKLIRDRMLTMRIPPDTRLSEVFAPKKKTFT